MNRQDFLQRMALLGAGSVFMPSLLAACSKDDNNPIDVNFSGNVLVIGAGAAGMMAAFALQQQGIEVQVLEAANRYGGRVKKTDTFADFPIDLGAEWIHTDPSQVFADLIMDESMEGSIDIIPYNPKTLYVWNNGKLRKNNWASNFYSEHKFKRTTWFDFFEDYIIPTIGSRIVYNSPVAEIDYSGSRVQVTAQDSTTYEADRIIVTVPLTVLKSGGINFSPPLPASKISALDNVEMPDGIKVFTQFSDRFYPDVVSPGSLLSDATGSYTYYDAAFKKETSMNVFGLFAVDRFASTYTDLGSDENIINYIIDEIDQMFDGKGSKHYVKHVIQNWSTEPYINGSYSHYGSDFNSTVETLREPIDNKVYFAGEAYHDTDSSTVHGAGFSGRDAANAIMAG